jgi:hypothetical protein
MKQLIALCLVMAVLGYFAGSLGRRSQQQAANKEDASSGRNASLKSNRTPAVQSVIRSEDTIASLAEVPAPELYDRLSLWLLDASPQDMQEFWGSYQNRTDRSNDLNDLVFISWTRVDPEAAIAAAEGTEFAKYPWWAWACHEPETALKEVLARYQGKEQNTQGPIGNVMWGLGEFHPAWLREHINELPEEWMKNYALQGYVKWTDTENPRESIEFLQQHNGNIDKKLILALGREDPIEAYDLALKLSADGNNYRYRGLASAVIESLVTEDPGLLDQLKDHIKAPAQQMKIGLLQFDQLLKNDPKAAQKMAESSKGWLQQDQLTGLGKHYLKADPAKALEIAGQILSVGSEPFSRWSRVSYENGSSASGMGEPPAQAFIRQLFESDPNGLLDQMITPEGQPVAAFQRVGHNLVSANVEAFASWVNDQDNPTVYRQGAHYVSSQLRNEALYQESMDWAQSIPKEEDASLFNPQFQQITSTYQNWLKSDPAAAQAWKESTTLSEQELNQLNQYNVSPPNNSIQSIHPFQSQ